MANLVAEADALAAIEAKARRVRTPCSGGSIVWRVWGEGEPLVLLHGAQGSWAHWIHTIPVLATSRSLWIPDLPGSGHSALPEGDDHAGYVHPLARGLAELLPQAGPLDVVGFSFGAVVATHLASLYPGLVRRLIVIGPGGLDTPLGDIAPRRLRGLSGSELEDAARQNLLQVMLHHEASADALAIDIFLQGVAQGRSNPVKLIMPDHLVTALARSTVPLDAIWGGLDRPHPDPAFQEAALRRFRPELRFRVVPDAGHWCMYERPAAFNAALQDLLARAPA
jgi:pimeloyl-ACP methyl ester carboxylesterase